MHRVHQPPQRGCSRPAVSLWPRMGSQATGTKRNTRTRRTMGAPPPTNGRMDQVGLECLCCSAGNRSKKEKRTEIHLLNAWAQFSDLFQQPEPGHPIRLKQMGNDYCISNLGMVVSNRPIHNSQPNKSDWQVVQARFYSINRNNFQSSDANGQADCWPIRHQSEAGQWFCWFTNQPPVTSNHERRADQSVTNRSDVPTGKFAHPNTRRRVWNLLHQERLFGHCIKDFARHPGPHDGSRGKYRMERNRRIGAIKPRRASTCWKSTSRAIPGTDSRFSTIPINFTKRRSLFERRHQFTGCLSATLAELEHMVPMKPVNMAGTCPTSETLPMKDQYGQGQKEVKQGSSSCLATKPHLFRLHTTTFVSGIFCCALPTEQFLNFKIDVFLIGAIHFQCVMIIHNVIILRAFFFVSPS